MRGTLGQAGRLYHRKMAVRAGGAVLLECVLALALFVTCGMAVLAMMDHAVDSVATTRDQEQAADLARSAMARIEAGLATPQTLNGPVTSWGDDSDNSDQKQEGSSTPWALEVQTEPSQFEGLTKVSVRAFKQVGDHDLASYTLHQLVRLTEKTEEPLSAPSPKARRTRS